jgi:hypothetical protein
MIDSNHSILERNSMSILPLGTTPADKPGRDYQDRLNGKLPRLVRDAVPHPDLVAKGYFKEFWGPSGMCPVQLMGTLVNGDFVYFRARGSKVVLEVSHLIEGAAHATYRKTVVVEGTELGTGVLPDAYAVACISRWLDDYLTRCGGSGKAYNGESIVIDEAADCIHV